MHTLPHIVGTCLWRLTVLMAALVCLVAPGQAAESLQFKSTTMDGFGRMILTFSDRLDLPGYQVSSDNGVLSITFTDPVTVTMPDVSSDLPDYISVAREDPDNRGLRFALKGDFRINKMQAGEQLFIDILPPDWVGLPPSLPAETIQNLADRAMQAEALAEQRRLAELAKQVKPEVEIKVGVNPTFIRLEFDWNIETKADYSIDGDVAQIKFGWPVPIDLYPLLSDKPREVEDAVSTVTPTGNVVRLSFAQDSKPRFYKVSDQQFVVDVERLNPDMATVTADDLLAQAQAEEAAQREAEADSEAKAALSVDGPAAIPETKQTELTPNVEKVGSSIRVAFPFDVETPAAVFRRGDVVWMVFDSPVAINAPTGGDILKQVSDDFSVISAGDTQIVRMQLNPERLASLGSEGAGWVVSIGDVVMNPSDPIRLNRRQNDKGQFQIAADLARPARVHEIRDPVVGDILDVVTMFPPARGLVRDLKYVDFDALRSVHGLVIRPINETLQVALTNREATISARDGLTVSSYVESRSIDGAVDPQQRRGYLDLTSYVEPNLGLLGSDIADLSQKAATSDGREREDMRLKLADTYLANQMPQEALGVVNTMISENGADDLQSQARVAQAVATVAAHRPAEALDMLNTPLLSDAVDGLMWRSIARSESGDYTGARDDALASETIVDSYPDWVRNWFLLSGTRAAVETDDLELANRLIERVVYSKLTPTDASQFTLLQGRIDELAGHKDEALDTYGQVISTDIRPSRAEAIYRTVLLLDQMGRLDTGKAIETLAVDSMAWRGGRLEAKVLELLAKLQFRDGDYRGAFTTVKTTAEAKIDPEQTEELTKQAQDVFADLYLNGEADALEPIDALTLYYDFRALTPAGARGDEMIRNLARRLIRVDLLEQAADLLEYQINSRLEGVARSQIAADAAIVYIANRTPDKALEVLNKTNLANLSPSLQRQRRILEARALIDAGRSQLALDVLQNLDGRDADLMRIDALWRDGSYRDAADQIELMYSRNGKVGELSQPARSLLIKAGAGFILSNDRIGLGRLRSKFAEAMSNSPEWPMFDYVTGPITQNSEGFRDLASEIAATDSLSGFLDAYRATYGPDGALAPLASGSQQSG